MKVNLCLFTILLCSNLLGQKRSNEFALLEKKVTKEFKIKELKKCKDLERCLANNKEFPSPDFYSGFHFLDFDKDGKIDIIANANCGESENKSIYFFRNIGSSYESIYGGIGIVINLRIDSSSKLIAFTRWQYPCCADNQNSYEDLILVSTKNKLSFKSVSTSCWIEGTKFPNKIDSSLKEEYETILETYKLRATPKIDETKKLTEDETVLGNVIAEYPKHSLCIKLAETVDAEGKVWWFVKMKNNILPTKNRIYRGDDKTPYYSFGWLSSKFLKKMVVNN